MEANEPVAVAEEGNSSLFGKLKNKNWRQIPNVCWRFLKDT